MKNLGMFKTIARTELKEREPDVSDGVLLYLNYAITQTAKLYDTELETLRASVKHWKQIAEDCAIASTKTEACEILQKALNADGDTGI